MRTYEVVVTIKPDLPDVALRSLRDKVKEFATKYNGQVVGFEDWGKQKLADPIKRYTKGHVIFHLVNADPEFPGALDKHLKIRDEVLRYLTFKVGEEAILMPSRRREEAPSLQGNLEEEGK